ncbi:hypothetical protein [uncultured Dialister sp.]|uniref:hypothetical protein n=1 Tax=Dialister succinatiphilus TaxID=487173 RepID=UPI00266EA423|nr:hypothetical protein [uncultured Dialister sp.]
MNKQEMVDTLTDVKAELYVLGTAIDSVLAALGAGESTEAKVKPAAPEEPKLSLEEVRAVLADKSMAGFRDEVKALITSFGVNRLSEVPADKYKELVEQAEAIGNGSN